MTATSLIWEDAALRRFAHAVRYGDMSVEGALSAYAAYQTAVAEEYRKLAVGMIENRLPTYLLCPHCAKEQA